MSAELLARLQFTLTVGFHYIFPPLTIGMAWMIFWIMTKYRRTGNELYRNMAKFWLHLFAISFVVGVASGITMEFQFGTNWAEYSRFVGDIFGAPLAAEGVFAFFLESTFVGILLFGWNKFSKKILWLSSLMVALGSTLSAFWIIVANSWMQTPAGYEIIDGHAVLTDFFAAVFNPSTLPRYFHTVDAALMTGAFFMMGISAYYLLKSRHLEFAKNSMKMAIIIAAISSIIQLNLGHWHGVQIAKTQPEKLALIEGIYNTETCAPMLLFGIPDDEAGKFWVIFQLPCMLSFLAHGDFNAAVTGLKDFPKEEWPPMILTYYPFHIMVAMGLFFIALSLWGVWLWFKKKNYNHSIFLKLAMYSLPLPIIANELGWITAEVGRQPWIVYRVMKTHEAISTSVPAYQVAISLALFAILYALLFFVWVYLLRKAILKGPSTEIATSTETTMQEEVSQ